MKRKNFNVRYAFWEAGLKFAEQNVKAKSAEEAAQIIYNENRAQEIVVDGRKVDIIPLIRRAP